LNGLEALVFLVRSDVREAHQKGQPDFETISGFHLLFAANECA